jgi:carboxypeptidase C (cathepsin A)
MTLAGQPLAYTASVQVMPVWDDKGRKLAEVVCTSYRLDGAKPAQRPVTFALNGGPGSSSFWLNLGALGPKRVPFGGPEHNPSDSPRLEDNPGTWLDFTDLVFIDPVGTGYSRLLVDEPESHQRFFTVKGDVACLSRVVYDWLQREGRMVSPKYLVGESYGGFRLPRMATALQTDLGVGISGLVLVSPFLDGQSGYRANVSPLAWAGLLPTLAAAHLERQGRLSAEALAPVEAYASSEYLVDLLKGWSDPAALDRLVRQVSAFTGLDPAVVRREGGRVGEFTGLRQPHRAKGQLGSMYDTNWTMADPNPWDLFPAGPMDPANKAVPVLTGAMLDFLGNGLGWKPQTRYVGLNWEVNGKWESGNPSWWATAESGQDLKQALALDRRMKVLVAHGYTDLATPYFHSRLLFAQIPPMGDPGRIQMRVYPGGHMFYARPGSLKAFREDARKLYG